MGKNQPKTRSSSLSPEQFLSAYPPEIRRLAERLRTLVGETVPTATEHVYPGWKALGYRDPQSGYFCGIFPQPDHVRLLFEHGAALPDPDRVLTGTTRQVRYLEVRDPDAIPIGPVQRLLRAALIHGAT
jgi:hypothetical protein